MHYGMCYISPMRNATLILGLMLIASSGHAACGVQDERATVQHDQVVGEMVDAPAMVFVVRNEPVPGDVAGLVTVSRVEYHAGILAPVVPQGVGPSRSFAHSSGGMPG